MAKREVRVQIGELSEAIQRELNLFQDDVVNRANAAAKRAAQDCAKDLRRTSPKKTGKYAKGWTSKLTSKSVLGTEIYTVHNRAKPGLTHLLEHGHLKVLFGNRTTERVAGIPHIAPAEQRAIEQFEREVLGE